MMLAGDKGKKQEQPFRYDATEKDPRYDAMIEPYQPFRLGVRQLEGAKHKDHSLVQCWPEQEPQPSGPDHLNLQCEDGSKFWIVGIEFPLKP